ncbi:MAG: PKD domain-containing protein [Methanolinea tarda]
MSIPHVFPTLGNLSLSYWFSNSSNPINTFTSPGMYTVSLTVKNAYGESTTSRPVIVR